MPRLAIDIGGTFTDLILFNDVDTHWSQKNESTENRIAISFNMNHKHHYQQRPRNYEPTTNKSYT